MKCFGSVCICQEPKGEMLRDQMLLPADLEYESANPSFFPNARIFQLSTCQQTSANPQQNNENEDADEKYDGTSLVDH